MTQKRFNLWDMEGTAFIEDHKEGSYHIGKTEDVDINSLRDITKRLNIYADENEQLKRILQEVEHELISITGLSAFDKCASHLGYVEVFDEDRIELDYSKLLKRIEKVIK